MQRRALAPWEGYHFPTNKIFARKLTNDDDKARRQAKETTTSDPCQVTTEKTARVAKGFAD
jgi:hypothetical protein